MKKSDLKPNMIVRYRDGSLRMIGEIGGELFFYGGGVWNALNRYDDNLLRIDKKKNLDIVEVMIPHLEYMFNENCWDGGKVIWRRKNITKEEKCFLEGFKEFDYWIAKDKSGTVFIYTTKPNKGNRCWITPCFANKVKTNLPFELLSWEDEKPINIDELLKETA